MLEDEIGAIYLPSDSAAGLLNGDFYSMCYHTLPSVLADVAQRKGVEVREFPPRANRRMRLPPRCDRRKLVDIATSSAMFVVRNVRNMSRLLIESNLPLFAVTGSIDDTVMNCLDTVRGVPIKVFPSYIHTRASRGHVDALLTVLRSKQIASQLNEDIVYGRVSLWHTLFPFIDRLLSTQIPLVVGRINWTEKFAGFLKPCSFVVHEDITPLSRSMCRILKNRNIPIVVVQHGILTHDMGGMYVMPVVADCQAVWGEFYKHWHVTRGGSPENQIVTGSPKHDQLKYISPLDRGEVCRRFGLNSGCDVALVATEWYQGSSSRFMIEQYEDYIRLVLRSLMAYENLQVVVKLHPSHQSIYRRIVTEVAEIEGANIVVARDSLWDLIRLSRFVVVSLSSVAIEALILHKPVISVNLLDDEDISGLVRAELVLSARNEGELHRAIMACIEPGEKQKSDDKSRMMMLNPFVFAVDGNSSARVAELVSTISVRNQIHTTDLYDEK